jgi:putative tryptophan/tyrosine transport system substrate-binding protein
MRRHRLFTALPALRALLLVVILAAATAVAAGQARAATGQQKDRPALDWLQIGSEMRAAYAIEPHPEDPARVTARPVWHGDAPAGYRLMLLIPIKSVVAYTISVETILALFRERKVPALFEIWYYAGDLEIAREAVAWAEAEPVDLIMPVGSEATQYLHETYRGGRLPVVTSASKDPVFMGQMPDYRTGSGTNIAYTSINVPIEVQIAYFRQLIPELKNVAVVYAENNLSAVQTQLNPLKDVADEYGLTVFEVPARNVTSAEADLTRNVPLALGAMRATDPELTGSIYLVTGSTTVYERVNVINRYSENVPVLATLPDVVTSGDDTAVVSIGISQSSAVQLAAIYALAVLEGRANVGELPVGVVNPPDIAISFRRARQIGLVIPFSFLESATFVYDYQGRLVREFGQRIHLTN